jgi:hypothetical protein
LLDLCAALSFDSVAQWRNVCRAKSLPQPEEMNERAISRLNDLYAKGITSAHPLYRDYRRAVAERDDERALSVLRTIVRLNPGDGSARQEIQRLESKIRDDLCGRLTRAVQERDSSAVLETLEQVEAAGWVGSVNGTVLNQARAVRQERDRELAFEHCSGLVTLLERLKDSGVWTETIGPIQEVERLCLAHGISLGVESTKTFDDVRQWAHSLQKQHDEEQQFQATLRDTAFLVEQGETRNAPGSRRDLKSLRGEQHTLLNKWRDLEAFGKSLPEDLQTRVKRRASGLQAEIDRLVRQRRLVTTVSVAVVVVVVIAAAMMLFQWRWTIGQIADLEKLQQDRRVAASEKFIDDLRHNEPNAVSRTKLAIAIQNTEQWIAEERKRLETFQGMLTKLQHHAQSAFTDAPVEIIARDLQQAHDFSNELAPEFRNTGESQFLEFENQFDSVLTAAKAKSQEEFQVLLTKANDLALSLEQRDITVQEARKNATALADVVGHLESMAQPPVTTLRLPESLTGQIPPLKVRLAPYLDDLNKLEVAETQMRRATTLEQYLAALEQYDADHLRQLPGVRNARKTDAAKAALVDIERLLLMPRDAEGWQVFVKNPVTPTLPSEVMPAELSKWLSVRDDDNLRDIYRYGMPITDLGVPVCSPHVQSAFYTRGAISKIVGGGGTAGGKMLFVATAYIPLPDSDEVKFDELSFGCEYKQAELPTPDQLGGPTAESQLLKQMGLGTWINDAGDKFNQPLLPMLDMLRAANSVSVLFKAYIQWRLLEIVAIRPQAWAARTVPAIESDRAALGEIGVADLHSGDWMVPSRTQRFESKLSDFYRRTRDVSYAKQAQFFDRLLLNAHTAGLKYAGYVDDDGTPMVIAEGSRAPSLWGLTEDGQKPTLLWRNRGASTGALPLATPQPFTPLFYCGREPDELLKTAGEESQLDYGDSFRTFNEFKQLIVNSGYEYGWSPMTPDDFLTLTSRKITAPPPL